METWKLCCTLSSPKVMIVIKPRATCIASQKLLIDVVRRCRVKFVHFLLESALDARWLCVNKWNDRVENRRWKQWPDALSRVAPRRVRRYTRHTYKFLAARRTFSECIIAKAGRNYRPWDIFQSRLRLSGPIGPEIEWIACTAPSPPPPSPSPVLPDA